MDQQKPAIVIGAGIVGVSCALHLQRAGYRVRVFDTQPPGLGASFGNAGSISTGSVVPMALPGMVRQVPKWLLDPQGPLAVRWRYLPKAAPWLLKWLQASRRPVVDRAARAIAALVLTSVQEYRDTLDSGAFEALIVRRGQLLVTTSESSGDDIATILRREHGVPMERVSADELRQLEPALSRDFKSGILITESAHTIDPHVLTRTVAELAEREGVELVRKEVRGIAMDGGRASGVLTEDGAERADIVVVAAGARSNVFSAALGDPIPLETERGYHVMLPNPGLSISRPIGNMDRKFFATLMEGGLRIAGTVEIAGLDAPADFRRADSLLRHAKAMFPDLNPAEPSKWLGHRPSIPDSVPVISRARRHPNVIYAFGHGHIGLTTGPITGRIVSALASGGTPPVDPAPYSVERFYAPA